MTPAYRPVRPRLARPRLGRRRRPDQARRRRPRPRDDAGPARAAGDDRGGDGQVPRPALGRDPRAPRRAGGPRLVLAARRSTQVAAVMQLTPAYLTAVATFYDMFSTVPEPRNDVYVCTNISCSLLGADEFFEAMLPRRPRATRTSTCARSSAWARATSRRWRRSTASTWVRSSSRTRADRRGPARRPAGARAQAAPLPRSADPAWPRSDEFGPPDAYRPRRHRRAPAEGEPDRRADGCDRDAPNGRVRPDRSDADKTDEQAAVRPHRRARAEHARGLRAPRRL